MNTSPESGRETGLGGPAPTPRDTTIPSGAAALDSEPAPPPTFLFDFIRLERLASDSVSVSNPKGYVFESWQVTAYDDIIVCWERDLSIPLP